MKLGKNNPIYKEIKDMIKKNDPRYIIVEDLNSLSLALLFKRKIEYFLYVDKDYHEETKKIMDEATFASSFVYEMEEQTFSSFAQKENSIGFIALVLIPQYTTKDFKNLDFLVVCDRLEIPGNLGTIYRTADSAKVSGIILVDSVTKIHNPKLALSSRGTNLIIPTMSMEFNEALKFLNDNNYNIFLGEPELGLDYKSYDYSGKIAIVIGNERFGINKDWYNHDHKKVYIPMEGHNNSLNVGVAASILIYEAYMKRRFNK